MNLAHSLGCQWGARPVSHMQACANPCSFCTVVHCCHLYGTRKLIIERPWSEGLRRVQASCSSFASGARIAAHPRAVVCRRNALPLAVRAAVAEADVEVEERLRLHNLAPQPGSRRPNKRKGRGYGAGQVRQPTDNGFGGSELAGLLWGQSTSHQLKSGTGCLNQACALS